MEQGQRWMELQLQESMLEQQLVLLLLVRFGN
jgi:hypothetical protein